MIIQSLFQLYLSSKFTHGIVILLKIINNMMKSMAPLPLLLLFLFEILAQNTTMVNSTKSYDSVAPKWLTSPYFRAGNQAVIATLTGNSSTPTFTFTFSSALSANPNLAYGIKNYRGKDYMGEQFYQIKKIGLSPSTFSVSIQIYGVTNLYLLNVAYLAVEPTFPHHFNTFDNVPLNYSSGDLVNITNKSLSLLYFTEYVNYTQQAFNRNFKTFSTPLSSNKVVLFMTSLWIRGTTGYPIQFHIDVDVISSDTYVLNATLFRNVLITNVHFSEIIFNIDDVESSDKYQIFYYEWINDRYGGFKAVPEEFVDNFIMGVKSFQTTNSRCGFEYQWEFANSSGVHGVQLLDSWTIGNYCGFSQSSTSVLYISTWRCEAPHLYFNTTTQLCQNLCGQYYFENNNISQCQQCSNDFCYQCDPMANSTCIDCQAQLGLILINGTCVCAEGYYFTPGGCTPCSTFNSGSVSCSYKPASRQAAFDPSLFSSSTCDQTMDFFLSSGACVACSLPHCADCDNLTSCATCAAGYSFNKFQRCDLCFVMGCDECSTNDPNFCSISNTAQGFFVDASGQSTSVCGDGLTAVGLQVCDDGNLIDGDGCSSACLIESDHNCFVLPSFLSKCYLFCGDGIRGASEVCDDGNVFDGDGCNSICQLQVNIQLQSIRRDLSRCNTLEFEYVASPPLPFLQSIDFSSLLLLSEPTLKILKWSYNAPNVKAIYDFSSNLQKAELSLIPNATLMSGYSNFSILFQPKAFTVSPINNVPANFIDEKTCNMKQTFQEGYSTIQSASFGLLFVAMITGKIIGLQLFGVLQLAYFCVGSLNSVNILLSPLMQMKLINGYSKPFMNSTPEILPNRIKQIDLYPSFLDNFNVMLFAAAGIFLIGVCLYASLKLLKIKSKKFAHFTYRVLKQFLLTVLLFSSLSIAYSSGVYYRFSTKDIYSTIASIGSLSALSVMAVLFPFIETIGFGEFKDKFKKDIIQSNYITFTLIYRGLLGFFLAFENQSHLSTLLVLGLNLAFVLYNLVNLPFKKAYHNYRACICHLSQFGIIFATMYYRSMKSNSNSADVAGIYLPAQIEFGLICFSFVVSAIALLYDSFLFIKQGIRDCLKKDENSRTNVQISHGNIMQQVIIVKSSLSYL